jgi:pimeloyl-ACP methyl ester carboxylesterase
MKPIVNQNILINNHRVSYGVFGQGEPVVLLHGTPASSLVWRNVIPQLVSGGYKVHTFDLLGYGESERPRDPDVDTSISAQVPILEALLEHWGLETAHIVGHDFGGAVSQRFSIFNPKRVRSLTLVDVVCFDSYPSPRTKEQMQRGLENLIKAPDADHKAHFREWLLTAVHNKYKFKQESLDTLLGYISDPIGQSSLFQHQIRHYDPKHTMEIADRLPELGNLPVKIIWGANDIWQVTDWAHKLNDTIPGSDLVILDECGHFAQEDQPDKIAQLLLEFIGKHK